MLFVYLFINYIILTLRTLRNVNNISLTQNIQIT